MLKKFLFFISLFIFSNVTFLLFAEIIPLKKPIQSKEVKEQKLLIDILRPLPKPTIKKIIKKEEKQPDKTTITKKEKNLGIILPKKKPLIVGLKEIDSAKKSKYYNKKDFALAKKAISEMKQAKWDSALKTSKKPKINLYITSYSGDTFNKRK